MAADSRDVWDQVEHRYADANGVKIHYAALGEGPLVVMIHGFPDFWYSWRKQMRALADNGYRTAAVDLRGYNRSDKPKGVANYAMPLLVGDIAAVVRAEQAER
ncbi:MAG: alpha/beta fold hydrolase, partial [Pseudomonadota bacterium]|nr:alpha/beta fold hydrolase [Pseudomonadota bacterium]